MRMSERVSDTTRALDESTCLDAPPHHTCSEHTADTPVQQHTPGASAKRLKPKLKLVRSLAVCEDLSPAAPLTPDQQDGDQVFDKQEWPLTADEDDPDGRANKLEKTPRKILSRDSSQEYTDSTGIDLHEFLVNTLKNNPRDRMMLLKLEQDVLDFISNMESQRRKFPPMTSYHRMLLHRVAAYFGLDHNVDQTGKCVVVNRTSSTRIPEHKFSQHIRDDKMDDLQKRFILKRDSSDQDDGPMRMKLKDDRRSKSIEEREEEYQRARERIFADGLEAFALDQRIQEDGVCVSVQQRRQIFRLKDGTQSSSETEAKSWGPRPWSSTDSDSSSRNLKPAMIKASSFSGDSSCSSRSAGRLSNTGSDSCSSVASSTGSLSLSQPMAVSYEPPASSAVTGYYLLPLEASGIPAGSVLVNTHTGQPFLNPDGTTVVYNPSLTPQPSRCQSSVAPPPATHQQPPTNHVLPPPLWSVQPSPAASYPPTLTASPNQQLTADSLSAPFSHMMLVRQASADGRDAHVYTQPPHHTAYVMPTPAFPVATPPQPPQQSFIPQQTPACFCSPAQFPVSAQPYRSPQGHMTSAATPHTGYQTMMPPQQSYQSVLQTPQGAAANQMQGMMVQYPPVPSYQVCVPQQSYQQPIISHAPLPLSNIQVYYSLLPPNQHNSARSSAAMAPPAGVEQMLLQRSSPPSGPQQSSGAPSAGVVMQLAFPQSLSHSQKGSGGARSSLKSGSPSFSPAQSSTLPIMPQFSRPPAAACDTRLPLLGQTLQYSPQLRPPLLQAPPTHSQAPAGLRHTARGRRTQRRAPPTDLSAAAAVCWR